MAKGHEREREREKERINIHEHVDQREQDQRGRAGEQGLLGAADRGVTNEC